MNELEERIDRILEHLEVRTYQAARANPKLKLGMIPNLISERDKDRDAIMAATTQPGAGTPRNTTEAAGRTTRRISSTDFGSHRKSGAGTTLPTSPQTDAVTEAFLTGDDNAAAPGTRGAMRPELERVIDSAYQDCAGVIAGRKGYHYRTRELTDYLETLIAADRIRLKSELRAALLERVGELRRIRVPWTNPDTGKTLDIQDADAVDRRLRAAVEEIMK